MMIILVFMVAVMLVFMVSFMIIIMVTLTVAFMVARGFEAPFAVVFVWQ